MIRVGIAAAIAAVLGWGIVQLVAAQVVDAAATADGRAAVGDIVNALVNGLSGTAFALAVIGIGLVIAGFVADRPRRGRAGGAGRATPGSAGRATDARPGASHSGRCRSRAGEASFGEGIGREDTGEGAKAPPAKPPAKKPAATKPAAAKPAAKKPAAAKPSREQVDRRDYAKDAGDLRPPAPDREERAQPPPGMGGFGRTFWTCSSVQMTSMSPVVMAWKTAPTTASARNARSQMNELLTTASTPP